MLELSWSETPALRARQRRWVGGLAPTSGSGDFLNGETEDTSTQCKDSLSSSR